MSLSFFDILNFELEDPGEYGFSKTYFSDDIKDKIRVVETETEALKLRNKGVLVKVEKYPMGLELIRGYEGKASVFLLDFSDILNSSGGKRASIIKRMRNFAKLCLKYKVPFVIASFAKNKEEMRTADELIHIGFLIGLNRGQSKEALSRIKELICE